jgi:hypothetical protein
MARTKRGIYFFINRRIDSGVKYDKNRIDKIFLRKKNSTPKMSGAGFDNFLKVVKSGRRGMAFYAE